MNVYCPTCQRQHEVRRPHAMRVGPESVNAQDILEIVSGVLVFGTLFLGVPFIVWLVAS